MEALIHMTMPSADETFTTGRRGPKRPAGVVVLAALAVTWFAAPAQAAAASRPSKATTILPDHKPPVPAAKEPPAPNSAPEPAAVDAPAAVQTITVTALPTGLTQREREIFSQAIKAATKNTWSKARTTVATARNPLLSKIIDWAFLHEPGPHAGFMERTAFIVANPKWPGATDIRRRAEESINSSIPPSVLLTWFAANPPLTTVGQLAYARALNSQGETAQAQTLVRDAWINGYLSKDGERDVLHEFKSILTPEDHWARIDRLLYEEQTAAAERLLPYVNPDLARVARARIALIGKARNAETVIAAIPASLQNDPGLLYDRIRWRRARNNMAGARELVPPFAVSSPHPDFWGRERQTLARDALAAGNVTEAYTLAKHHGTVDVLSVSEGEWLAGWIALRFLKDGESALAHFEKVYDSTQVPLTMSRGAYWTGRTMEFLNRPDLAAQWYQRAATYVTTFHGQLALARLTGDTVPQLPQDPDPTPEERADFNTAELSRALRALMEVDARSYQRSFVQALTDNAASAAERHMTAELVSQLARVDLGVVIARQAARDKITLLQYGWPAPPYAYPSTPEKALILSIARQESNFDAAAQSGAGARGLMQLMPGTARGLAKATKQTYAEKRLTTDTAYNIRLGSAYLTSMLDTFDGSFVLTAAAYNAGPGRARQWIKQFGDPRDPHVDAIDWIEQIPFNETRNYVKRVMENLMVYRALLADTPQVQRTLEAELARHQ